MKNMLTEIAGFKIVLSNFACHPEYEYIKRSWRERLFSRPWEPRRRYNQIIKELNPYIIQKENLLIVHPALMETLEKEFAPKGTPKK